MYATLGSPLTSILALAQSHQAWIHARPHTERKREREANRHKERGTKTDIETVTQTHTHTYGCCVVRGAKDELWRSVVARADVRYVGLPLDQHLGAPEIAQLEHPRVVVHKQVLGFDVPVAYPFPVDVCEGPVELVRV